MQSKNIIDIKSGIYKKGSIRFDQVYKAVKNNPLIKESGAILTFTGIARNTSKLGKPVRQMKIDSYDQLGNQVILEICQCLKIKYKLIDIKIIHLKGKFDISEDLVYVIVACAHREEGFIALMEAIDRYKKELPVWMNEEFVEGNSKWA